MLCPNRSAPGIGWILAALIIWVMFMLCMWEGHHYRRKPERPLLREAWRTSGTTSRSETSYWSREHKPEDVQIIEISTYIHTYIIWLLLTSTGVDAVLRHGCWSHSSSLHRAASSIFGEVLISNITHDPNLLISILIDLQDFPIYFQMSSPSDICRYAGNGCELPPSQSKLGALPGGFSGRLWRASEGDEEVSDDSGWRCLSASARWQVMIYLFYDVLGNRFAFI